MSRCDECRRGFIRAAITGPLLLLPGCGGDPSPTDPEDGATPHEEDDGPAGYEAESGEKETVEAGPCQPTCATGPKTLQFPFATYPQLKSVGGSAVSRVPGYSDPSCHLDLVIVAQPSPGAWVAFSASCPHQCCTVAFNAAHVEFVCPCHGSTFNVGGQVTGGPAPNGLEPLSVCADECGVTVTVP